MSRYAHTLVQQEDDAVKKLPDLSLPSEQEQAATATDGKRAGLSQNGSKRLTPKLRPLLTPTAYCENDELASGVALLSTSPEVVAKPKHIEAGKLSAESHPVSPVVRIKNGEGGIRPCGLFSFLWTPNC
jgi:hypothetical protein